MTAGIVETVETKSEWSGYLWGVLAPLICTAIDWPLRHWLGPASILMIYLLGVFLVASRYGRGASIVASVLSAPVFAFYFAKPIFSFAIHDLENIIGLLVMMLVANVTGRLLEKSRHQARLATQREQRTNAMYRLSQALLLAQDVASVSRCAEMHLQQELGLPCVLLMADALRQSRQPNTELSEFDAALARQVLQTGIFKRDLDLAYYPLHGSGGCLAVLVIQLSPSASREIGTYLETACHLIAQTLERLQFAGQAREATLSAETEALRNALLSSISHDLRTPLTRIMSAISDVLDNESSLSTAERQDVHQLVLDEAQRMSELTGKLLDMARLSSGEIALHRDWNAIEEIVGSALNRLDKQLKSHPVRTQVPEHLPLQWLDAVLMEQVLVNLIENACKYSPAGSAIEIGSRLEADQCQLWVADQGGGIEAGQEQRIFEKFYRALPESEQSGVGLGLALCKAIVEAHGGSIAVANSQHGGALFTINLPLHEAPRFGPADEREGHQ